MLKRSALSLALLGATTLAQADILTSVKPLGFIAAAIADGVTETKVLLPATASPHDYALKPSDIEQLKSADLVVWIGEEMESFLEKSIDQLPKANVLTLEKVDAIEEIVEKAKKESDDDHDKKHGDHKHEHKEHQHEHKDHSHHGEHEHDHDHDEDWHIWLSPEASDLIAQQIAYRLNEKFPRQHSKITLNLANFRMALAEKNREISQQLAAYQGKGYYTFHDAYRHFEGAYGLTSLGSFTINPSVAPGAKTLAKIKQHLSEKKAQCLFAEPQFTPKVIESLSKGTEAHIGQLDPLGVKIELGPNAYPQFLQSIADEFSECLAK